MMERFRNFDFRKHMPSLVFTLVAVAFIAGAGAITVYLGLYNIAADAPHSRMTYSVMETFRERSIAARSGSIAVPTDLAAPARIASGAGLYTEMCSGCHLAPGMEKTEMRSEEHTSELQSLMRISYAVFCLKKKKMTNKDTKRYSTKKN